MVERKNGRKKKDTEEERTNKFKVWKKQKKGWRQTQTQTHTHIESDLNDKAFFIASLTQRRCK